ncbi:endonuclease III [Phenylobacterium aquaticum]|uniref:endonuclease III domain-containing protein n=1 Tax=Phenylobacterium aquaticum TaxID=1763816 RepID=UPI0026EC6430|nr:endonuclease III [Phenylobacterium aquaticum]
MQTRLAFPSDLPPVRERLREVFGPQKPGQRLDPVSELIKAMLSVRTYDEVTWSAFVRLRAAYPDWKALACAEPWQIAPMIDPVTFSEQKARQLPTLIRVILIQAGEMSLDFLGEMPADEAMAWLTRLPGVGVKVAAATLNFSTLAGRALVVDTHTHRVARRLGLTARNGDALEAQASLSAMVPADWSSEDLFELHWLMKPHGQSICTHFDPACDLCALRDACPRVGVAQDQERSVTPFTPTRVPR